MGAAGYSAEDASLAIGLMANSGIKASQAGTALRFGITSMLKPTDEAASLMDKYNIELTDGKGKMKDFDEVMKILRDRFKGLSKDQQITTASTLFGKRAMSGWLAIINASDKDFDKLTNATNEYNGAAEEMAETMMNNLSGQVTILKSSLEGIRIEIGNLLLPVIKKAAKLAQFLADKFAGLGTNTKRVILVVAGLVAAIGPVVTAFGIGTVAVGALITAFTTIAGVISGISLPIIGIGLALGGLTGAAVYFTNKAFPLIDSFKLIKKVITGDLQGTIKDLKKNFGLSGKEAEKFGNRLKEIKDKATDVIKVISDNLGPAIEIIGEKFFGSSGKMSTFNQSTKETKKNTMGLFGTIVEGVEKLVNYLYDLFDSFGLLPNKVEQSLTETEKQFIKLKGTSQQHLNAVIKEQANFGKAFRNNNYSMLQGMQKDTTKALNDELKFTIEKLNEKKNKSLEIVKKSFGESAVLTEKGEKEAIAKTEKHYQDQIDKLKENNKKIQEIYTNRKGKTVTLTQDEINTINTLRTEYNAKSLSALEESEKGQYNILQLSKTKGLELSKQNTIELINEAKHKKEETIKIAGEEKEDRINNAIFMRDELGSISYEQAESEIQEAYRAYENTVKSANDTYTETKSIAEAKHGDIITEQELENADMSDKQEELKEILTSVWGTIKEEVPGLAADAAIEIVKAFGSALLDGIATAMADASKYIANNPLEVGKTLVKGATLPARTTGKTVVKNVTKLPTFAPMKALGALGSAIAGKFATGTSNYPGGIGLVGEEGPELVSLPKSSKIFDNTKTQQILSNQTKSNLFGNSINQLQNIKSEIQSLATKKFADTFKGLEKGSEEYKRATEDMANEVNSNFNSALDKVQSFVSSVQSRANQLTDFGGLFNKVTMDKKFSGEKLLNNLKSQLNYMATWKNNLAKIGQQIGTNSNLYQKLLSMGPEASGEIGALSGMSTDKLAEYMDIFEKKRDLSYKLGYAMETGARQEEIKNQQFIVNITGNKISDDIDVDNMANKIIQRLQLAGIR
jgi:uncharacterized protein YukE